MRVDAPHRRLNNVSGRMLRCRAILLCFLPCTLSPIRVSPVQHCFGPFAADCSFWPVIFFCGNGHYLRFPSVAAVVVKELDGICVFQGHDSMLLTLRQGMSIYSKKNGNRLSVTMPTLNLTRKHTLHGLMKGKGHQTLIL